MAVKRWLAVVALWTFAGGADAQKPPKRASPTPAPTTIDARLTCRHVLGQGVATARTFCDIEADTDPKSGATVKIPPHRGTARLIFDLHNRQMYSAELVDRGRAYTRATATIGVLTMDRTLLARAVVQTEFRRAGDLFDRIAAGPGMEGVKAVAPIGSEAVAVEIPEGIDEVSILGEKVVVVRLDATETITGLGRPIAVVSAAKLEYRPGPPPRRRR